MLSRVLAALAAFVCLTGFAHAQDAHPASGVWCSSHDFARAFVMKWDGTNSEEALAAVNAGATDTLACRAATVAIYEVEEFERVETKIGTWLLVKVMVVAVQSQAGWTPLPPFEAYTARKVEPLPGEGA